MMRALFAPRFSFFAVPFIVAASSMLLDGHWIIVLLLLTGGSIITATGEVIFVEAA